MKTLFQFGGFPEPLLSQDEIELRRWHLQRVSKLVRIDSRDLENVSDLDKDALGYRSELRYIRDENGREVDFVVLRDRKPLFAVECKLFDTDISPSLLEFKSKLDIPKWYQVHMGTKTRVISPDFSILPFEKLCKELALV